MKKKKDNLLIVGASSTAKQAYEFIKEYDLYEVIGFAVDSEYRSDSDFCGLPLYELDKIEDIFDMRKIKVFIAILWNRLNAERRKIYERLKEKGYQFANLISPSAKIRGKIKGGNCWIHDYVIIQLGSEIGEDCMIMAFSLIGAFSKIGSHCFLGTKSTVAGECEVGGQTFIGMNCTVFDNTRVGEKCILGACTAVKRDLENYTLVKTQTSTNIFEKLDKEVIENKLLFSLNIR